MGGGGKVSLQRQPGHNAASWSVGLYETFTGRIEFIAVHAIFAQVSCVMLTTRNVRKKITAFFFLGWRGTKLD